MNATQTTTQPRLEVTPYNFAEVLPPEDVLDLPPAPERGLEKVLSPSEASLLGKCEDTIQKYRDAWWKMAEAMVTVRVYKLWREKYHSFGAFCLAHLGRSAHSVRQIEHAAEVRKVIQDSQPMPPKIQPEKESQARPLVPLLKEKGPEAVVKTYNRARDFAGGEVPTARQVQRAVDEARGTKGEEPDRFEREVGKHRFVVDANLWETIQECFVADVIRKGKAPYRPKQFFHYGEDKALWVATEIVTDISEPPYAECYRLDHTKTKDWTPETWFDGRLSYEGCPIDYWGATLYMTSPAIFVGPDDDGEAHEREIEKANRCTKSCYVSRELLEKAGQSVSCGKIHEGKPPFKIEPPFLYNGQLWCGVSSLSSGQGGMEEVDACLLVDPLAYHGNEWSLGDLGYQGCPVRWKGKSYVLGMRAKFLLLGKSRADDLAAKRWEEAKATNERQAEFVSTVKEIQLQSCSTARSHCLESVKTAMAPIKPWCPGLFGQALYHLQSAQTELDRIGEDLAQKMNPSKRENGREKAHPPSPIGYGATGKAQKKTKKGKVHTKAPASAKATARQVSETKSKKTINVSPLLPSLPSVKSGRSFVLVKGNGQNRKWFGQNMNGKNDSWTTARALANEYPDAASAMTASRKAGGKVVAA